MKDQARTTTVCDETSRETLPPGGAPLSECCPRERFTAVTVIKPRCGNRRIPASANAGVFPSTEIEPHRARGMNGCGLSRSVR